MDIPNIALQLDVLNKPGEDIKNMKRSFCSNLSAIVGGALLISGTCIGGGMLGLPVKTAALGLLPSACVFILVWAVMTFTALVLLEVALYFKGEINFISMALKTIGPWGGKVAWAVYLLFLYSVMAAYAAGGTTMLAETLHINLQDSVALCKTTLIFSVPFIGMVYLGAVIVDYVNRALILGLVISFGVIFFCVTQLPNHIAYPAGYVKYLGFALPLVVTSFGYHLLIPTLKYYLHENITQLRLAIIIGSLIPFVIYMVWEVVVLSFVPTWGENGLVSMLHGSANPGELLVRSLETDHYKLALAVALFSFFALTSSFVGVALGLFDFFADGLHIRKTHKGRLFLTVLTFVPPILFTILYPKGFLLALGYAGIFAAILLIIYPALMAWYGRYIREIKSDYKVRGGKCGLFIAIAFGVIVIFAEIASELNWIPIPH